MGATIVKGVRNHDFETERNSLVRQLNPFLLFTHPENLRPSISVRQVRLGGTTRPGTRRRSHASLLSEDRKGVGRRILAH